MKLIASCEVAVIRTKAKRKEIVTERIEDCTSKAWFSSLSAPLVIKGDYRCIMGVSRQMGLSIGGLDLEFCFSSLFLQYRG